MKFPSPPSLIVFIGIALAAYAALGVDISPLNADKVTAPTVITYARYGVGEGRMKVLKPDGTPVVIGQPFNSVVPTNSVPSPAVALEALPAPAVVQLTPNAWQLTWTPKAGEVYGIFSATSLGTPTHWAEVGITTTNSGSVTVGMKRHDGKPITNMFFSTIALKQ